MAYDSSKGPRHFGDIQYENDPDDTQIDFANDYIALKTGAARRLVVSGANGSVGIGVNEPTHLLTVGGTISGSSTLEIVGATTLGSTLNVSGTTLLAGNVQILGTLYGGSPLEVSGGLSVTGSVTVSGSDGVSTFSTTGSSLSSGSHSTSGSAGVTTYLLSGSGYTTISTSGSYTTGSGGSVEITGGHIIVSASSPAITITGGDLTVSGSSYLGSQAYHKLVLPVGSTIGTISDYGLLTLQAGHLAAAGAISGSSTLEIVGATTLGSTLAVSGTATLAANLNVIQSSNNSIMSSSNHNGDIIFHGNSAQEIGRFDGSAGTLLMNTNKKIRFADGGEYVVSNGTDLTVASGADIILAPAGGDVLPDGDGTRNLGSAGKRWANVYTADLHLKNDRGNWTVVEEEDCLTLRNNNTGKKYKLLMEEID